MTLSHCPVCSWTCFDPPVLTGPAFFQGHHSGRHSLMPCCALSRGAPWLKGEPEDCRRALAAWWEDQRQAAGMAWKLALIETALERQSFDRVEQLPEPVAPLLLEEKCTQAALFP